MLLRILNKKCFKRVDFENNKYIDSNVEVIVNYNEIFNKLKFDISAYKYLP